MQHENYTNILKSLALKYKLEVSEARRQATENLPDSFSELLEPLLKIIANNKALLLKGASDNDSLVIGDMQFASTCIVNDNQEEACFTLLYYTKDSARPDEKYFIVNFTTGEIMNDNRYYDLLGCGDEDESASLTYGYLPKSELVKAWSKCKDVEFTTRFKSPITSFIANHPLNVCAVGFFNSNVEAEKERDSLCISPSRG